MNKLRSLTLSATFLGLNGCGPENTRTHAPEKSQSNQVEPGKRNEVINTNHQPQSSSVADSALRTALREELALRSGEEAYVADAEFQKLLEKWKPVGRTVGNLKEVLGSPDEESADFVKYHFDTGWVAWEYVFSIEHGKVAKYEVID